MRRNLSELDRSIRVQVAGAVALLIALAGIRDVNLMWMMVFSLGLIVSAAAAFCPIYAVLGIKTCE